MTKKALIVLAGLLLALPMFGQVSVDLPDMPERVDLTFQYENPDAEDVFMIGGFNGWTENDEEYRMELNEDGLYEYTMNVRSNASITYKFFVDGEYLTDPHAPATTDDGFGGQNGVVQVANLAGGAAGDASPAFIFGTFTELVSEATFLTADKHSLNSGKNDDSARGYEATDWKLNTKSYWKLTADLLPWLETFIELRVFDGSTTLYSVGDDAAGTDSDNELDPEVTVVDGAENLGSMLFNPFTALQGDEVPLLGHFRATATTPYVNLNTGYHWVKGTGHESILYTTSSADDEDANDGYLEIVLGDELSGIGDLGSVDAVLALTKRTGKHGIYSWATFNLMEDYTVDVAYNALMDGEDDLRYFGFDAKQMATLGASADLLDGMLSLKGQYLANFGGNIEFGEEYMAYGGGFTLTPGVMNLNVNVDARWGGADVATLLGDDDGLKKGLFVTEANFELQPLDLVKLGHDYTLEMANDFEGDLTNEFNPWVNLYLGEIAPVDTQLDIWSNMKLVGDDFDLEDVGTTLTLRELTPQLTQAMVRYQYNHDPDADYNDDIRAQVSLAELSEIMPSARIDVAYQAGSKLATLVASMDFVNRVGADLGFVLRDLDEYIPFGFALGGRFTLPEELRDGVLFASYTFDFDPYSTEDIQSIEFDDGYVDTTGGAGESKFRIGAVWNF